MREVMRMLTITHRTGTWLFGLLGVGTHEMFRVVIRMLKLQYSITFIESSPNIKLKVGTHDGTSPCD